MLLLVHLVEKYREVSYIEKARIHLTGYSLGGYGTWSLATLYPNLFASAIPMLVERFARNRSGFRLVCRSFY